MDVNGFVDAGYPKESDEGGWITRYVFMLKECAMKG